MYLHSYTIIKSNFLLLQLGGLISFKHVICNKQIITCQEPDRFYSLVFNTAEHPSHGVKGAFWMFPSPYNINLLITYLLIHME